jgi:MFS family permease
VARVDSLRIRAGQIFCACDSDGLPVDLGNLPQSASVLRMALAFGASVLAQVLTLSVLPLASASLAPDPNAQPMPYLALLLGAALASYPASILMDLFGRKSAFALGASLGLAGGILAAWAIMERQFAMLVIAALWLGMAQGFSLFYRHAGAMAARAGGIVFGAGALGALLGPFLMQGVNGLTGPLAGAYALGLVGLVNAATLALAIGLPARQIEIESVAPALTRPSLVLFVSATAIGSVAWFAMTGIMARAPLMMAGCGIGLSMTASAMAVHLAAMYVPGFVIGRWVSASGGLKVGLIGLGLVALGGVGLLFQTSTIGFSLSMIIAGFGWGTATIGAMAALHARGQPTLTALACHDTALFVSALLGAWMLGRLS